MLKFKTFDTRARPLDALVNNVKDFVHVRVVVHVKGVVHVKKCPALDER